MPSVLEVSLYQKKEQQLTQQGQEVSDDTVQSQVKVNKPMQDVKQTK